MAIKNFLNPFPLFTAGTSLQSALLSQSIDISYLDNVSLQIAWTGNATGVFNIQGSVDNVTFNTITLSANPTPAGSSDSVLVDMNNLSFPYIRLKYTSTFFESYVVTTVADVAGSLNSTYFTLNGADGINYYVWFNINSAGVDPAIAGRTGIQVAAATGASANTIAVAINTAFAGNPSFSHSVATNNVTLTQLTAGHGDIANGAASPGFSYMKTQTNGTVAAFIAGKQI